MAIKIKEIDGEYYVLRSPNKVCMIVRHYKYDNRFERADTGLLGDKYVPSDVEKAIRKFRQLARTFEKAEK